MAIITLTTDFGTGSAYVAAVKGVILSINPEAAVVDISHKIPPHDIRRAAMLLDDASGCYPPDTIHLAVVDPGVGSERNIVYARIGGQQYVAPDNGLLSRLAERIPPSKIIRLSEPEYWRHPVSATFQGRDIMAPVAARLSLGLNPDLLGQPLGQLHALDWPRVSSAPARIDGIVIDIDAFGNLITNIEAESFAGRPTDRRVCIVCNIYEMWGIYRTYSDQPSGSLIALIDSSGRLEVALVGGNAARRLGIELGTPVTLAWE